MKVKIINNGMNTHDCKVFIDGQDVTRNLTEIDVKIKADEIPTLKLTFYPDEIEVEGDFNVFKKIPEERTKETMKFSIGDIKGEVESEELIKELSKHFEQALKSIN